MGPEAILALVAVAVVVALAVRFAMRSGLAALGRVVGRVLLVVLGFVAGSAVASALVGEKKPTMAESFLPIGLGVSFVAVGWIGFLCFRKAYLRRMGVRHFTRRPAETALVVMGSILGTALITGSLITNDSLTQSLTKKVYEQIGEVDELVQLTTDSAVSRAEQRLPAIERIGFVDGAVLLTTDTGTARSAVNTGLTEPRTQVFALDLADLDHFGSGRQSVRGPNLEPTDAVVTEDLAKELDVRPGDDIELLLYGRARKFRVARVATGNGFAKYRDGKDVYLSKDALVDMAAGSRSRVGPKHEMWVSNKGADVAGDKLTFVVTSELERTLGSKGVNVVLVKHTAVEVAETAADNISQLFLVTGSFAVVAGILLLVNIFVMLAAERKPEMGMLRAVGMKRSDLVRGFTLEGSFYGAAAAFAGAFAGIGVGAAIVTIASSIFERSVVGQPTTISLVLEGGTISSGALMGFAISFVTIFLTSGRISRINIIAAVRDLDEGKAKKPRLLTLVAGFAAVVLGALMAVAGVTAVSPIPALLGGVLIGGGLVPLLGRLFPQRVVLTFVGLGLLAWGIGMPMLIPNIMQNESGPMVFVVQGLTTTFSAVIVLSQNQEMLSSLVRRLARTSPRRGLAARLATTYPVARRFRTAMTLIMYALIVFTLTMITIVGHVQEVNNDSFARRESSGYDILARTNTATPTTARELEKTPGVENAVGISTSPFNLKIPDSDKEAFDSVYGIDDDFLGLTAYSLSGFDEKYKDADAVWAAVQRDPRLVLLGRTYRPGRNQGPPSAIQVEVGEPIEMVDPVSGRKTTRTVVGYVNSTLALPGAFISSRALDDQFAAAGKTIWLVKVAPGHGATTVADQLQAEHVEVGLKAQGFRALIEDIMALNLQFFGLLRGFLALGLIVGIVGLGVIMIRAVRERRRAIGVLRALGFASATVRRAFIGEAGLVAVEGILLGIALGLITAKNVLSSSMASNFDIPFAVPWSSIWLLAGVSFFFSLLVAALPARAAAKIRPAVALRIAD